MNTEGGNGLRRVVKAPGAGIHSSFMAVHGLGHLLGLYDDLTLAVIYY